MPQQLLFRNNVQLSTEIEEQMDIDTAQDKLYSFLKRKRISVEGIGVIERENSAPILVVSLLSNYFKKFAKKIPTQFEGFKVEPEMTVKAVLLGSRRKLK